MVVIFNLAFIKRWGPVDPARSQKFQTARLPSLGV